MTWSWSTTNAGHHRATGSKSETLSLGRGMDELPVGNEAAQEGSHLRAVETSVCCNGLSA